MRNTGLEEAQAGIKIARRNINNLRYADDTTLMAKSEEELKSLLKSEVAQSCLTLCNPMDCNLQRSSVHAIFQARVLFLCSVHLIRLSHLSLLSFGTLHLD